MGALRCQETPIMPRGERVCWSSIFKFYTHASLCLAFCHTPPSSLLLAFVFLIPWPFTRFGGWTRLYCMLALPGTFRVHDKGMQSADAEGAYHDGRCSTARVCERDPHFPI